MPLTQHQLKQRLTGLGGSDIGSVLGLNSYRGAHDVWAEKRGLIAPADLSDNPFIQFGNVMEPVLLEHYKEATGASVMAGEGTISHPERPWHLASVDGLVGPTGRPDGVLEAKTASWRMKDQWGEAGTDQVPESYLVQCAWYMAALDLPWCDLVALVDRSFSIYHIERNPELESAIVEAGERFWLDHVEAGVPPETDGSDGCREVLSALHPATTDKVLVATPEVEALCVRLRDIKLTQKEQKAEEAAIKNALAEFVGSNKGIEASCGKVTWTKASQRQTVQWKALAESLNIPAEDIERFTKTSQIARSIRPYFKKE